jgi:hypothetical protein
VSTRVSTNALGFVLKTLLTQIIALSVAVLTWPLVGSVPLLLLLSTAASLFVATFLELPTAWRVLNAVLPIATATSLANEIPAWLFLMPLIALAAVYAPALLTRVPYYPTPRAAYALLLAELPTDRSFTMIDVGCGMGDLLRFLSAQRPNGSFVGVEVGLVPFLVSSVKALGRPNLTIHFRSMWHEDFADYDFVYTFLSPAAMPRVWDKVGSEMRAGTTFITNSFPVPAEAHEVLEVRDERASRLYIHRIFGQVAQSEAQGL